jgi:hypothetical protein
MTRIILTTCATTMLLVASGWNARQSAAQQPPGGEQPTQAMSFFVTSVGSGKGGDLGGLTGADAHCHALAKAAGAGNKTWRAYLSTQGPNAVNARDRIGKGPWYNARGRMVARDLAHLHGDTLDLARVGNSISLATVLTENGEPVPTTPNQHDILTGSQPDGRAYSDAADHTCQNWTSSATGSAQVGHYDRRGATFISWNSAHPSRGCSMPALAESGGTGLLYCFATD